MADERLVTASRVDDDAQYESGLRPRTLDEYIGQDKHPREPARGHHRRAAARRGPRSRAALRAARPRQDHAGPRHRQRARRGHAPDRQVRSSSAPAISPRMLSNLQARDVLFIDEVHRMSPAIEEILYPAMEDYRARHRHRRGAGRAVGQAPGAAVHADRRDHAHRPADVAAARAVRDRAAPRLLHRTRTSSRSCCGRRGSSASRSSGMPPGRSPRRSRGTPRVANRLLRRVRDYAQVRADGRITQDVADRALQMLEVDGTASTRSIAACC